MTSYLRNYAIAFLLTIVVEVAVALVLGYRRRLEIAGIVWVNVFSHPLLNYLIWILDSSGAIPVNLAEILLFEAGVVLVEWQLLCFALRQRPMSRLFVLSLAMNGVSYLAGMLVPFGTI